MPAPHADPTADALRRTLGSQFEVLGVLGRGGMGVVYRAREIFLERDVAVKVLPGDLASGSARERFLREARTAAKLSHPNIVPLYTFGQADDLLYFVMGFVEGESLESRLRREGRLSVDETRRVLDELADALDYAHQAGVVHRDLKPDNVLMDRHSGRAMLTDFGVAKQSAKLETLTQTGMIVGTPHYMSPEQAAGERDIDGRSDLYSLGVIAYRMATGRLPFEGTALRDVLAQHATRTPVSPTQLVPSLPPSIENVIMRALAKAPTDRWPNARAMRDALAPESEDSLPESLGNITGLGPRLAFITLGFAELAFLGGRFGWWDSQTAILTVAASTLVPLIGAAALVSPWRRFGRRPTLTHFFRQPGWWSTWWPRWARRSNDVWDRLPKDIRAVRSIGGSGMLANLLLVNVMFWGMTEQYRTGAPGFMETFHWWAFGFLGLWMLLFVPRMRGLVKRLKSLGLSRPEIQRVFSGPTWGSFWERPHVAAMLQGPSATGARTDRRQPRELLSDVQALARAEAASPHADIYQEAANAAGVMCRAIDDLEQELGQLARDSDPREHARIQSSLDALGPASAESTVKAQMRELLERQLRLLNDLAIRREQLSSRRDHLLEQLRTLALQLAHLRSAASPAATAEITGQIRSVCRDIAYRVAGEREAARVPW